MMNEYEYVTKKEVKPCRTYSSMKMCQLVKKLREEDIISQFVLVGSGGHNMVTRIKSGNVCRNDYDLDYNLVIIKMPKEYWDNPGKLKSLVTDRMNSLINRSHQGGQDSTAAIIYHPLHITSEYHKLDIGIVTRFKPNLPMSRLVRSNQNHSYKWEEVPHSKDMKSKVKKINISGLNPKFRDVYLDMKKRYHKDENHPTFIIYVEAVNQVYQSVRKGGEKTMAKVSGNNHTQSQMNHYANQSNPNNASHRAALNNHANQNNPNNKAYKGK